MSCGTVLVWRVERYFSRTQGKQHMAKQLSTSFLISRDTLAKIKKLQIVLQQELKVNKISRADAINHAVSAALQSRTEQQ